MYSKGGTNLSKKFFRNIIISVVIVIMFIGCFIGIRIMTYKDDMIDVGINFYFVETTTSVMKSERHEVKGETNEDIVKSVLNELKSGPKSEGLRGVIPKEVNFNNINLDKNLVTLDLSPEYNNLSFGDELIIRASIVQTLTGLDFIDFVKITVSGEELKKTNGQPVGIMSASDFIIDDVISPEPKNYKVVKLYFQNRNATGFNVEEREIEVNPNEPLEKYIIEELIKGPNEADSYPTVPSETKLRSIKTETTDGICYVDLSSDFVTKHSGGSTSEWFTIYSIVNSLTELDNVNKVQFLIEGEKLQEFKGHIDFSKLFEADKVYGD